MLRNTPAQLIEEVWREVRLVVYPNRSTDGIVFAGGRQRGLGIQGSQLVGIDPDPNGQIPYLVYQYEGGSIVPTFEALRETERAISYVVWDIDIHSADVIEQKLVEALRRTKRLVGINQSYSFIDSSTGRPQIPGATNRRLSTLIGIQREVIIRR